MSSEDSSAPVPILAMTPVQPVPIKTLAARFKDTAGPKTAIYRRFADGDAQNCQLCSADDCCRQGNECLIIVNLHVKRGDAKLFSTRNLEGFQWQHGTSGLDIPPGAAGEHRSECSDPVVRGHEGKESVRLPFIQ